MQKKIIIGAYNFQDFAQTQENFARSHNRETVTFRNSVCRKGVSVSTEGTVVNRASQFLDI